MNNETVLLYDLFFLVKSILSAFTCSGSNLSRHLFKMQPPVLGYRIHATKLDILPATLAFKRARKEERGEEVAKNRASWVCSLNTGCFKTKIRYGRTGEGTSRAKNCSEKTVLDNMKLCLFIVLCISAALAENRCKSKFIFAYISLQFNSLFLALNLFHYQTYKL